MAQNKTVDWHYNDANHLTVNESCRHKRTSVLVWVVRLLSKIVLDNWQAITNLRKLQGIKTFN